MPAAHSLSMGATQLAILLVCVVPFAAAALTNASSVKETSAPVAVADGTQPIQLTTVPVPAHADSSFSTKLNSQTESTTGATSGAVYETSSPVSALSPEVRNSAVVQNLLPVPAWFMVIVIMVVAVAPIRRFLKWSMGGQADLWWARFAKLKKRAVRKRYLSFCSRALTICMPAHQATHWISVQVRAMH